MKKPLALVVEDDPDVSELYSHLMRLLGFAPHVRSSGDEARAWLRENLPNLIILDLRLEGGISGLDILDRIREDDRLIDSLVIVISGYPRMTEGLREKADLVLLKPVDVRQLAGLIQRLQVGNPNLLPADFDPFDTRLLEEEIFLERVGFNLVRTTKQETCFAVIAIDLKRTYPTGAVPEEIEARLPSEAARRMRRRLRLVDLTMRSADGMFFVMLYEIREPQNAVQIAGRLTGILAQRFIYDSIQIEHKTAAGVAVSAPGVGTAQDMLRMARLAARDAAGMKGGVAMAAAPEQET